MVTEADRLAFEQKVLPRTRREGRILNGQRCLVFQGARTRSKGGERLYGLVRVGQKVRNVHRLAFEVRHGPLPPDVFVLHRCDNPPCIEDAHHFTGDDKANAIDCARKGRTSAMKLTPDQVRAIRKARAEGEKLVPIAERFGVSRALVGHIATGREWAWLT